MSSKSFSQARLMAGAAHDPVFAKKVGISSDVAKDYNKADAKTGFLKSAMRVQPRKLQEGGRVKKQKPVGADESMIKGISPELLEQTRPRDPNSAKDAFEEQYDMFRKPKTLFRGDEVVPNAKPVSKARGGAVRGVGAAQRGFGKGDIY